MATYAIGDIQGCFEPLERLLRRVGFVPQQDKLWLTGDLVNRGPDSLAVLRFAMALGSGVQAVLGNHDLRLLAIGRGVQDLKPQDTLHAVLQAPDKAALLSWLQAQPLLHAEGNHMMVHAGLLPTWRNAEAAAHARAISAALQGPDATAFLQCLAQPLPTGGQAPPGQPFGALVHAAKVLTYMRLCSPDGALHLDFTGPPGQAPEGFVPWFTVPPVERRPGVVICGHWSALGLHVGDGICALDTGCAWGGQLTAYRLEDGVVFCEPAARPVS